MSETREPMWCRLTPEQLLELGVSTYDGEVVLLDGGTPMSRESGSFHFNAQEHFSPAEIEAMPWYGSALRVLLDKISLLERGLGIAVTTMKEIADLDPYDDSLYGAMCRASNALSQLEQDKP